MNKLIKNGILFYRGDFVPFDILVKDGKVAEVGPHLNVEPGVELIDATGLTVLPGFVDLHVHFREPGFEYKETIESGSRSAARGGFTTVCTMPNLKPAPDSEKSLGRQLDIIRDTACVEVIPYATITRGRIGEVTVDFEALRDKVAGFSDDGSGIQNQDVMEKAMRECAAAGSMIAAHCEVNSLLNGGYIHDGDYARAHGHRGICSESEWKEVERDIRLAEKTGCHLHVCHISTKESVDLIRDAKRRGVRVSCETGPHYLAFCDEDLQEDGRFKMNPPLRSRSDMEALREGIIDGTIDVIATDHAPHSAEEKGKGLEKSAMGVVGLETSLSAVNTYMVETGRITLKRLVELMSENGNRILGRKNGINVGAPADLVLVDLNEEYTVDPEEFLSKGHATPFEGCRLKGRVKATLHNGEFVYRE